MIDISQADNHHIKRRDLPNQNGWQFQFEVEPLKESKYFSDPKYGSKEASLAAARKYRDEFFETVEELGLMRVGGQLPGTSIPIFLNLTARNTSGIVGVCRIVSRRTNRDRTDEMWAASYRDDLGRQKQKKFYIPKLGEKQALLSALHFRRNYVASLIPHVAMQAKRELVEKHEEDLAFLIEYIETAVNELDLYAFLSTLGRPDLSPTEKQALIDARIGQAKFRKLVLAMWRGRCCITGCSIFLTAAHLKPWALATDAERMDPYNGLPLSPNFDKAFDNGLITFDETGRIVLSSSLGKDALLLGITGDECLIDLDSRYANYLEFHRRNIFKL